MKLKDSKTYLNLARSYAGECQARTRYEFMEYGARMQGLTALAELIDKVVYNEFNHARMFYTFIQQSEEKRVDNIEISAGFPFKEKWDLTESLRLAAEDEEAEAEKIYPEFAATAREEGFPEIAGLYEDIICVERCHKKLFSELHEQMKNGTMYKKKQKVKWKCGGCGYEAESKEAWQECPLCKAKQGVVLLKIDDGA